jgi:hypothetical protein
MYVGIAAAGSLVSEDATTGMQLRGEPIQEIDEASGAQVRLQRNMKLGDKSLAGFRVHPPYRTGVGMVFWQRDIRLPPRGALEFYTGMGERAPGRSDGVVFAVELAETRQGRAGRFERVLEHAQVESKWVRHRAALDKWGGKQVRLRFVADVGPNDDATTDHACWGAVRVVGPGKNKPVTRNERFMTWVNDKAFSSSFYFSEIHSPTVDLTFAVEGHEPIYLSDLTAHAAPDVVYREFENGLAIANPSPRSATMDMEQLLPGQRFRRLQGSSQQDPVANNGTVAGRKLELRPKEGLFLIRVE